MWLTMGSTSFLATCPLLFPAGLTLVDTGTEGKQLTLPVSLLLLTLRPLQKITPICPCQELQHHLVATTLMKKILVAATKPDPNLLHH